MISNCCKRISSPGTQGEGQPPGGLLEEGASLRNVVIGSLLRMACTAWAIARSTTCGGKTSVKMLRLPGSAGTTMRVDCGGAFLGTDKTFQHNGQGAPHQPLRG